MSSKIAFFTFSRAELGLQENVIKSVSKNVSGYETHLFVGGGHLDGRFGMTIDDVKSRFKDSNINIVEIKSSKIDGKAKITSTLITKELASLIGEIADMAASIEIDTFFVTGDRWEMLAPSQIALLNNKPLVHFMSGEILEGISEGTIDQDIRFAITQMSSMCITTLPCYAEVVSKYGVEDDRISVVGYPVVEELKDRTWLASEYMSKAYDYDFSKPFLLATYHAETRINVDQNMKALSSMIEALKKSNSRVVFTAPNIEDGTSDLLDYIEWSVKDNVNWHLVKSFGPKYLDVLKLSSGVIGNSSSGIIEAPVLGVPTINIGGRQVGRYKPPSVIDTLPDPESIYNAISSIDRKKTNLSFSREIMGDGNTSEYVVSVINDLKKWDKSKLFMKKFDFTVNKKKWRTCYEYTRCCPTS